MKLIGKGWQYSTYDLENGRVLKKYNSVPIAYAIMLRDCFPFIRNPIWKLPGYYRGCKETARDSIKKLSQHTLEDWMLGKPKILNEFDYEQDKVIPLHIYLPSLNEIEGKILIDEFVALNKVLVEKQLIDKSFNIGKNFGLDSQKRIILN